MTNCTKHNSCNKCNKCVKKKTVCCPPTVPLTCCPTSSCVVPVCGPQGCGPQGNIGLTGLTGCDGPQGSIGITGLQGVLGPQGILGPQGPSDGPQGVEGPVGAQGDVGPAGPTGAQGATGELGPQGPSAGPQGVDGPTGDLGPQGPQGVGPQGDTGEAGPQGVVGAQGPSGGLQGVVGPQGVQGPIGDVCTLRASSEIIGEAVSCMGGIVDPDVLTQDPIMVSYCAQSDVITARDIVEVCGSFAKNGVTLTLIQICADSYLGSYYIDVEIPLATVLPHHDVEDIHIVAASGTVYGKRVVKNSSDIVTHNEPIEGCLGSSVCVTQLPSSDCNTLNLRLMGNLTAGVSTFASTTGTCPVTMSLNFNYKLCMSMPKV
jgi:hypothetical protein